MECWSVNNSRTCGRSLVSSATTHVHKHFLWFIRMFGDIFHGFFKTCRSMWVTAKQCIVRLYLFYGRVMPIHVRERVAKLYCITLFQISVDQPMYVYSLDIYGRYIVKLGIPWIP